MSRPDRQDRDALVQALEDAGARVRGSSVQCPFHEDRSDSGSVYVGTDGAPRFKCHSCGVGGDLWDVLAKTADMTTEAWLAATREGELPEIGPRAAAAPPKPARHWPTLADMVEAKAREIGGALEAVYQYDVPGDELPALVVARIRKQGGKTFRQGHHDGVGWTDTAGPKPWPLYRLASVVSSEAVVITEGEKAADALATVGIPATTCPCGSGKAEHADLSPLQGKRVCIWPDNDEAGRKHADDLAERLARLPVPPQVRRIDPARLAYAMPAKGDAVEFIAAAATSGDDPRTAVRAALKASDVTGPAAELAELLQAQIDGRHALVSWPWRALTAASRALLPGTTTIICGSPGAAKSFFLLEAMWRMQLNGVSVAVLMLEDSRAYHLQRALAQMDFNGKLTNADWVMCNPAESTAAYGRHSAALDTLGRALWAGDPMTLDQVADWIAARVAAGARVIAVDPITLADPGKRESWSADREFMARVESILKTSGASLILVSHPRKTTGPARSSDPSMDDLAGGAVYQRAARTVLFIGGKPEDAHVEIEGFGQRVARVTKRVHVIKARNSPGMGAKIGFRFNTDSLCFDEVGKIIPED